MSNRITNEELDEILAELREMWTNLVDVAMEVPAAREMVGPRRQLPLVIAMVFEQAKKT